jgi:mannosyl-3-phosphoglycerate phosphatase
MRLSKYRGTSSAGFQGNKIVVFTDLDGTLLDHCTYSAEAAMPLVKRLTDAGAAIVFCSSKTRAEQELYRKKLGISAPFIVEDGGAIFVSKGYFPFPYKYHRVIGDYQVVELGMPYREIQRILKGISEKNNMAVGGFDGMDAAQIASLTGLDVAQAKLAKKREYEETLNLTGSDEEIRLILSKIEESGLSWSKGGRFYGVMGGSNKGRATKILIGLFNRKLGRIKTIGVGDSFNDVPMLAEVDVPVLVQKPGSYWEDIELANLHRIDGVGPEAWVKAIEELTGI